eukprot:5516991-Prymnesium_polylepis.1
MEAFGLSAGHTQDWLKDLEACGYGHTPEGRAQLTVTAHAQMKAIASRDDDASGTCDDDASAARDESTIASAAKCARQLVAKEQAQLQEAIMQHAAKDESRTVEALGYFPDDRSDRWV